jgi:hypothetical protein
MLLDVGRDRDRLDVFQALKPAPLRPGQELADGVIICDPRIFVADWNREKLKEPFGRLRANIGDNCWHLKGIGSCEG